MRCPYEDISEKVKIKMLKPAFMRYILFKLFSPIFPKRHIIGRQNVLSADIKPPQNYSNPRLLVGRSI